MDLQILDELDDSLADVRHANSRCLKGSAGFDITFDSSKSNVISDYAKVMQKIKTCMESFGGQVDKDADKIEAVRDHFVSLDKGLSQAILERGRLKGRDTPRRHNL